MNFLTLGLIMLFSAMLPGPDFAIVTKNTLLHSRRAGIYTTLGISAAVLVHMTYCVLGFAAIIRESPVLFHVVQYVGAIYLAYLGFKLIIAKAPEPVESMEESHKKITKMPAKKAFQQGFFCNLFNPKATLFFLTLFSLVITAKTPFWVSLAYGAEMFFIAVLWFCTLTCLLSHSAISAILNKVRNSVEKVLGVGLIVMALVMVFW